jgi:hypothetical protein
VSFTRATIRTEAQQIAQNSPNTGTTGVQLLLTDPGDYNEAIDQALKILNQDRPNLRVKDHTVVAAGFRFVIQGTGTILPADLTTDADAWVAGASYMVDVWHPYDDANQGQEPLDRNEWKTVLAPGDKIQLVLLQVQAAIGDVLRLEYVTPYRIHEDTAASTSIPLGLKDALVALTGSLILDLAANKAIQNTGNTNLPNDVVDRRSQASEFRSAAKRWRDNYNLLVGKGAKEDLKPASGSIDIDVPSSHPSGFLWHSSRER